MPTIDQLGAAIVASDDDQIPISQSGSLRRVSRAQLLSGMQTTLSLGSGLLGRTSPGVGGPEHIVVGSGLSLTNGVLSGSQRFAVGALPTASTIMPGDMLAVSQSGQDRSVSVTSLLSTPGLDVSNQAVSSQVGAPRRLGEWISDAIAIEAFGAAGDGSTDDTKSFRIAAASGRAIRLSDRTYRVDGEWSVSGSIILVGTPGRSTLRRTQQSGGAWINVAGPSFSAYGVIFDGGGFATESWGILVGSNCTRTVFDACEVTNVRGSGLASGLVIQARDGLAGHGSSHTVRNSKFSRNSQHGLWLQAAAGAIVEGCEAYQNGEYGICLDFNDPAFGQTVRQSAVVGCRCWSNSRGISVGNYNETNTEPPRWGLSNPDAADILVAGNTCFDNAAYAIAVSGQRLRVVENQVTIGVSPGGASGILCNSSRSVLSNNTVSGPGMYGIDAGGCCDTDIIQNVIDQCDVAINAGGGERIRLIGNSMFSNARAITVFQIETDGAGSNFGLRCDDLEVRDNVVTIKDSNGGGIFIADGAQNIRIVNNSFRAGAGSHPSQAVLALTNTVEMAGNRWNGSSSFIAAPVVNGPVTSLTYPELFDRVVIASQSGPIGRIVGENQARLSGQISFILVLAGGRGYSAAEVSISGSGVGARATAYLRDGIVIGIALQSGGAGYDNAHVAVAISGDGQGAAAQAFVGLPTPDDRRLIVHAEVPVTFAWNGGQNGLQNWTGYDISVPLGSESTWLGSAGAWTAVSFSQSDYLATSRGSVLLSSKHGDLTLQPASDGYLRTNSSVEAAGFVSCLGRGLPEGVVAAPPGSDYRNLDGGVGTTLWIKQAGVDRFGWAAIG